MKTNLLIFISALLLVSCHDKESEEIIDLKGTVKGKVTLVNEFGFPENDQSGASWSFSDGTKDFSAATNQTGDFLLENVPIGTYNATLQKPDYSPATIRGIRIAGGKEPFYLSYYLSRPSTTKITELSMQFVNGFINLNGKVKHNYAGDFFYVRLVIFFGNTPDVSPQKHSRSVTTYFSQPSGTALSVNINLESRLFPSGSTVYAVVYGQSSTSYISINPETFLYEYTGLSTSPSNVASVKIP
jgi:hypothetical protein